MTSVDAHRIGVELGDVDGRFDERYGVGRDGAVLIRPDGYVAWRSDAVADPAATLDAALGQVLGRASRSE
ncbi:MAG: hypothetical protein ACRDQ0_10625 [Pseudonocardia sp.]